eukprot:TRINITY_DN35660_c0_g1_i1.p1 TRINITY_DN35660_c0_g1~~TRINITY_DN35660_c0_g1_i1.p1  ORF type:complete len:2554 (-),score=753.58 TRINITY_DN35660_c0_g1_i1:158-7819(-)
MLPGTSSQPQLYPYVSMNLAAPSQTAASLGTPPPVGSHVFPPLAVAPISAGMARNVSPVRAPSPRQFVHLDQAHFANATYNTTYGGSYVFSPKGTAMVGSQSTSRLATSPSRRSTETLVTSPSASLISPTTYQPQFFAATAQVRQDYSPSRVAVVRTASPLRRGISPVRTQVGVAPPLATHTGYSRSTTPIIMRPAGQVTPPAAAVNAVPITVASALVCRRQQAEGEPVMQGWLAMRGATGDLRWERHWCTLKNRRLEYYEAGEKAFQLLPTSRAVGFGAAAAARAENRGAPGDAADLAAARPWGFVLDVVGEAEGRRRYVYLDPGSAEALEAWVSAIGREAAKFSNSDSWAEAEACKSAIDARGKAEAFVRCGGTFTPAQSTAAGNSSPARSRQATSPGGVHHGFDTGDITPTASPSSPERQRQACFPSPTKLNGHTQVNSFGTSFVSGGYSPPLGHSPTSGSLSVSAASPTHAKSLDGSGNLIKNFKWDGLSAPKDEMAELAAVNQALQAELSELRAKSQATDKPQNQVSEAAMAEYSQQGCSGELPLQLVGSSGGTGLDASPGPGAMDLVWRAEAAREALELRLKSEQSELQSLQQQKMAALWAALPGEEAGEDAAKRFTALNADLEREVSQRLAADAARESLLAKLKSLEDAAEKTSQGDKEAELHKAQGQASELLAAAALVEERTPSFSEEPGQGPKPSPAAQAALGAAAAQVPAGTGDSGPAMEATTSEMMKTSALAGLREKLNPELLKPGTAVVLLSTTTMRAGEELDTELLREYEKGEQCTVMHRGAAPESRRVKVRVNSDKVEGWISFVTASGDVKVEVQESQPQQQPQQPQQQPPLQPPSPKNTRKSFFGFGSRSASPAPPSPAPASLSGRDSPRSASPSVGGPSTNGTPREPVSPPSINVLSPGAATPTTPTRKKSFLGFGMGSSKEKPQEAPSTPTGESASSPASPKTASAPATEQEEAKEEPVQRERRNSKGSTMSGISNISAARKGLFGRSKPKDPETSSNNGDAGTPRRRSFFGFGGSSSKAPKNLPNRSFHVGQAVEVVRQTTMRDSEELTSGEVGKLIPGTRGCVLNIGYTEASARRLKVQVNHEGLLRSGWLSCETADGDRLLTPLTEEIGVAQWVQCNAGDDMPATAVEATPNSVISRWGTDAGHMSVGSDGKLAAFVGSATPQQQVGEVLTLQPSARVDWQTVKSGDFMPANALQVATDLDEKAVFIGRIGADVGSVSTHDTFMDGELSSVFQHCHVGGRQQSEAEVLILRAAGDGGKVLKASALKHAEKPLVQLNVLLQHVDFEALLANATARSKLLGALKEQVANEVGGKTAGMTAQNVSLDIMPGNDASDATILQAEVRCGSSTAVRTTLGILHNVGNQSVGKHLGDKVNSLSGLGKTKKGTVVATVQQGYPSLKHVGCLQYDLTTGPPEAAPSPTSSAGKGPPPPLETQAASSKGSATPDQAMSPRTALAQALAPVVQKPSAATFKLDPDELAEGWAVIGHELIGQRARRYFSGHEPVDATIVAWHEEDVLFKLVHDDGDTEDLEQDEVDAAVFSYVSETGGQSPAISRKVSEVELNVDNSCGGELTPAQVDILKMLVKKEGNKGSDLNHRQFVKVMREACGNNVASDDALHAVLGEVDLNNDGCITLSELCRLFANVKNSKVRGLGHGGNFFKVQVTIVSAQGLKHIVSQKEDDIWCKCLVKTACPTGKQAICKTNIVKGSLKPVWNETFDLHPWCIGESLEFTIYEKAGNTDKVEGVVTLPTEKFYPNGFLGEVPVPGLEKSGGSLYLRVVPATSQSPPPPPVVREVSQKLGAPGTPPRSPRFAERESVAQIPNNKAGAWELSRQEKELGWLLDGHAFVQQKVQRVFETGTISGTIVAWHKEAPQLFKALHDDGDIEDLSASEVQEAMLLWQEAEKKRLAAQAKKAPAKKSIFAFGSSKKTADKAQPPASSNTLSPTASPKDEKKPLRKSFFGGFGKSKEEKKDLTPTPKSSGGRLTSFFVGSKNTKQEAAASPASPGSGGSQVREAREEEPKWKLSPEDVDMGWLLSGHPAIGLRVHLQYPPGDGNVMAYHPGDPNLFKVVLDDGAEEVELQTQTMQTALLEWQKRQPVCAEVVNWKLSNEDAADGWETQGHAQLGKRVRRTIGNSSTNGTVVAHCRGDLRILHDDGDEEDLDDDELEEAIKVYEKIYGPQPSRPAGSSKKQDTGNSPRSVTRSDKDSDAESEDYLSEDDFCKWIGGVYAQNSEALGKVEQRTAVAAEKLTVDENWLPPVHPKTPEERENLKKAITKSFIFNTLSGENLEKVIDAFTLMQEVGPDTTMIREGDIVESSTPALYVVYSGTLDVFKKKEGMDYPGAKVHTYDKMGATFGELACLYNCPRAATVISTSDVRYWSIDRETFSQLVKGAAQEQRQRHIEFLESVELLSTLTAQERATIADVLELQVFSQGEHIIRKGDDGNELFIIAEGAAYASLSGMRVKEYGAKQYFGELALLRRQVRAADIIADATPTKVLSIDGDSFRRLLGNLADIMAERAQEYTAADTPRTDRTD